MKKQLLLGIACTLSAQVYASGIPMTNINPGTKLVTNEQVQNAVATISTALEKIEPILKDGVLDAVKTLVYRAQQDAQGMKFLVNNPKATCKEIHKHLDPILKTISLENALIMDVKSAYGELYQLFLNYVKNNIYGQLMEYV